MSEPSAACRRCGRTEHEGLESSWGAGLRRCEHCGFVDTPDGPGHSGPDGARATFDADRTLLTLPWRRHPRTWPVLLGTALWFWFTANTMTGLTFDDLLHPWVILRAAGMAGIGLPMAYYAVAMLLNRTELHLRERHVDVRHGPLPWVGQWTFEHREVSQLYCKGDDPEGPQRGLHSLMVRLHDGRDLDLYGGLRTPAPLRYVEAIAEGHLGLADRPMPFESRS